jgi:hypothetical protein
MSEPACPIHGPMMLVVITQGEGENEVYLGKAWFCTHNDTNSRDYCDNCEDYHEELEQLEMKL